jgi:hypothetical protein
MKDGKVLDDTMDDLEVMSDERVVANFDAQAARALGAKQAGELKASIYNLDKIDKVSNFVKLCAKK